MEQAGLFVTGENETIITEIRGSYVFIIVVRGLEIAFLEKYNHVTLLDEEGIPNYGGVIPLTQPVSSKLGCEENLEL